MILAPCLGYQTNDSSLAAIDSSRVGAQLTIVKLAAWLLMNWPTGFVQAAMPSR